MKKAIDKVKDAGKYLLANPKVTLTLLILACVMFFVVKC